MPITTASLELVHGASEEHPNGRVVAVACWLRPDGTYAALAGDPAGLPLVVETEGDVGRGATWQDAAEDALQQHGERERRRLAAHGTTLHAA